MCLVSKTDIMLQSRSQSAVLLWQG